MSNHLLSTMPPPRNSLPIGINCLNHQRQSFGVNKTSSKLLVGIFALLSELDTTKQLRAILPCRRLCAATWVQRHIGQQLFRWLLSGKHAIRFLLLLILCLVSGCNYGLSGTFDNDSRAWLWAFGEPHPGPGASVINSRYWSSSHFTAEYIWHFELALSESAVEKLMSDDDLRRVEQAVVVKDVVVDRPSWFLPNGLDGYTVLVSISSPTFYVFVNQSTGQTYMSSWQL